MDEDELFERLSNATDRQPIVDEALGKGVSPTTITEMLDYLDFVGQQGKTKDR
jgi:hypothetical protein